MWRTARKVRVSSGLVFRRSLYEFRDEWHREHVNALRQLRRNANLSQQQCAQLLGVPVNTFRMWDSGLRPIPCGVIERVTVSLTEHVRDTEPLSLDQLASESCVHERTLRAAARSGRLVVHLSSQSAFGRPIRRATRQAARAFMEDYYRKSYSRFAIKPPAPNVVVPSDYAHRLRYLRRQLRMTQTQLATTIGAAGKAVVYQWESGKRTPSPVFWRRIEQLRR